MGCSTSRPWPLHVRRHGLRAAMFLTAPVLSLIVLQSSEVCSPNGPSWLFAQFARLTTHLYWCGSTNLYSRHSAWLDGGGKRRSCQSHPVNQRSPKGPSSQTSWTTSIFGAQQQPTELRGPSVSSTCTALSNHQPLVNQSESCQACPLACQARFSSTNLTLQP